MLPTAIVCFVLSAAAFAAGVLQLLGKGPLLNNAWIFASQKERAEMDKRPHYRQTGVVLLLVGGIFLLNGVQALTGWYWLLWPILALGLGVLVYALVSTVRIWRHLN